MRANPGCTVSLRFASRLLTAWSSSYLPSHSFSVSFAGSSCPLSHPQVRVAWGSVIFSFTFCFDGDPIGPHGFNYHLHVNISQIYITSPGFSPKLQTHVSCSCPKLLLQLTEGAELQYSPHLPKKQASQATHPSSVFTMISLQRSDPDLLHELSGTAWFSCP